MVITAKCAHCGAQIVFNETDEATICKYCDSVNAIPVFVPQATSKVVRNEPSYNTVQDEIILREVIPEVKYAANHYITPGNAQGGHIWITDHELYFKPHKFNFGDLSKRYIRIQDICGYEKGPLTFLTIHTKKGYAMELVTWKKDEIINILEAKRRAHFEDKWEPIPALTQGNCHHFAIDNGGSAYKPKSGMKTWKKILIGVLIWWLLSLMLLLFI